MTSRRLLQEYLAIPAEKRTHQVKSELYEILLNYPCFQTVAENDFSQFSKLSDCMRFERVEADVNIIEQGDEPDNAYVVILGECEVTVSFTYARMGRTKVKNKTMCRVGNKSLFGELSLLFKGKRTATVTTLEATNVLVIPYAPFRKYMRNPLLRKLNVTI